jgi:hypothetical protein
MPEPVLPFAGEERVLLGAADDQPGDNMGNSHEISFSYISFLYPVALPISACP